MYVVCFFMENYYSNAYTWTGNIIHVLVIFFFFLVLQKFGLPTIVAIKFKAFTLQM